MDQLHSEADASVMGAMSALSRTSRAALDKSCLTYSSIPVAMIEEAKQNVLRAKDAGRATDFTFEKYYLSALRYLALRMMDSDVLVPEVQNREPETRLRFWVDVRAAGEVETFWEKYWSRRYSGWTGSRSTMFRNALRIYNEQVAQHGSWDDQAIADKWRRLRRVN